MMCHRLREGPSNEAHRGLSGQLGKVHSLHTHADRPKGGINDRVVGAGHLAGGVQLGNKYRIATQ